jgi:hypothetical protein
MSCLAAALLVQRGIGVQELAQMHQLRSGLRKTLGGRRTVVAVRRAV